MEAAQRLDRTYHFILETFVRHGYAPHYTDIAKAFSVKPDEGKRLLHELMNTKLPNWLYPNTDLIASFAPFNNLPTQYRIREIGDALHIFTFTNKPARARSLSCQDKPE